MTIERVTEISLKYQFPKPIREQPRIIFSGDAEEFFRKGWDPDTIEAFEEFKLMLLNRRNHLLGIAKIGEGGIHGVHVDLKKIFAIAVKGNATAIVLAHNHPSGDCYPSPSDDEITRRMCQVASALDMVVIDHLILTKDASFSFANSGLLERHQSGTKNNTTRSRPA